MQSPSELKRRQSDGNQFPFDDVALKAKKTSRLATGVAMIGVHRHLLAKLTLAYSAAIALELAKFIDKFRGKSRPAKSRSIVKELSELRIGAQSFFHTLLRSGFVSRDLVVSKPTRNMLRSRVYLTSVGFAILTCVVAAVAFVLSSASFWRETFDSPQLKDVLLILLVVLPLICAVPRPLFRSAFRFLHGDILSHRLSPNIAQDDSRRLVFVITDRLAGPVAI